MQKSGLFVLYRVIEESLPEAVPGVNMVTQEAPPVRY